MGIGAGKQELRRRKPTERPWKTRERLGAVFLRERGKDYLMCLPVFGLIHIIICINKYFVAVLYNLAWVDGEREVVGRVRSHTLLQRLYSSFCCRSSILLCILLSSRSDSSLISFLLGIPRQSPSFSGILKHTCQFPLLCQPLLVMFVCFASWPSPVLLTVPSVLPSSTGDTTLLRCWLVLHVLGSAAPAAAIPGSRVRGYQIPTLIKVVKTAFTQ